MISYNTSTTQSLPGVLLYSETVPSRMLLQLTCGVEVLEGLCNTLGHRLLTLTNPDSWVVVPVVIRLATVQHYLALNSTYFLFGLSAPSGLPTWLLT